MNLLHRNFAEKIKSAENRRGQLWYFVWNPREIRFKQDKSKRLLHEFRLPELVSRKINLLPCRLLFWIFLASSRSRNLSTQVLSFKCLKYNSLNKSYKASVITSLSYLKIKFIILKKNTYFIFFSNHFFFLIKRLWFSLNSRARVVHL